MKTRNTKRILITGGAGFIGSNLAEELSKENEVTILDNFHTGSWENLKGIKDKVKVIEVSSGEILNLDIPNLDVIFHFGIASSSPMYRENPKLVGEVTNDAISVFEFVKREKVEKVVFASSSSIYNGLPLPFKEDTELKVTDYYTEARICIERLAQLYHQLHEVNSIGLRLFSVYGFREKAKGKYANIVSQFLWDMRKDRAPIIFGDGTQTRDFTFIKDVVEACKLIMNSDLKCEVINIGTGKSYTFNTIVDILNKLLGKNLKPKYVKNEIGNYVQHTLADTTKVKSLLGFVPACSLEEGIKQILSKEYL